MKLPKINLGSLGLRFAAWLVKKSILKLTTRSLNQKNIISMVETRVIELANGVKVTVTVTVTDSGDVHVERVIENLDVESYIQGATADYVGGRPKQR